MSTPASQFLWIMGATPLFFSFVGTILAARYAPHGSWVVGRVASNFQYFLVCLAIIYLPMAIFRARPVNSNFLLLTLIFMIVGCIVIATLMRAQPWLYSIWSSLNPPFSVLGYTGFILALTGNRASAELNLLITVFCGLVVYWMGTKTQHNRRSLLFFVATLVGGAFVAMLAFQIGIEIQVIRAEQIYVAVAVGSTLNMLSLKWYMGEFRV